MNRMCWFTSLLAEQGIYLNEHQEQQFETYFQLLIQWNERMNLTGITEREAVYEKHFFDSLSLCFYLDMDDFARLADIGSGAGFPSIPIKICFPHLKVMIVDSLNKRIQFLQHVVDQLGLQNVNCVHGRAEDIGRMIQYRDSFDLVTARAVAKLAVLNEFCLPFVQVGGTFAAMKGTDPSDEIKEATLSLKELKGEVGELHRFILPLEQSTRHIIRINKIASTPRKYPRKAGLPLKQPIL